MTAVISSLQLGTDDDLRRDCADHEFHARLAGRSWRLMTPPQHLWYFTPASMARLSASTGLRMERCEHPWKLVPISLISFQVARMLGARAKGPAGSRLGIPVNLFDAMRCLLRTV